MFLSVSVSYVKLGDIHLLIYTTFVCLPTFFEKEPKNSSQIQKYLYTYDVYIFMFL